MNRKIIASLILAAVAFQAGAATPTAELKREQASIPFVGHLSIRNWEADGQDGIWVQDVRKKWYYGKLMSPCVGLDFATSIAFVTQGDTLDRFSRIVVPDYKEQHCPLDSFTASEAPLPKKERIAKAKAEKAAAEAAK